MIQRIQKPRFFVLAVFALAALFFAVSPLGAATAHDQLIDSSPLPDEELAQSPTEATLRFSAEVVEIGAEIALVNADTSEVIELPETFTTDYDTLTQPLPELPAGSYALNWRVVSQDGHPISGTINFSVAGDPAAEEPAADSADAAAENGDEAAEQEIAPGAVPGDSTENGGEFGSPEAADSEGGMAPWMTFALGGVALLVAAGAIVAFIMRMRRGNTPGQGPGTGDSSN
ncbi:MAG: copper resistance CopC family protein [Gulosibacter sp.]|uniref:copper resistance CopC family protein n=1 Tax=Gulosibacter sp. TaxID=2817531 RepID=UPI003F90EB89